MPALYQFLIWVLASLISVGGVWMVGTGLSRKWRYNSRLAMMDAMAARREMPASELARYRDQLEQLTQSGATRSNGSIRTRGIRGSILNLDINNDHSVKHLPRP